jgi:glutamate/tyrosine decarboxylase-like PLP-dependent enzyme
VGTAPQMTVAASPRLPSSGIDADTLFARLDTARAHDADWRAGRIWSLVYYGGSDHTAFLHEVFRLYSSENGLSTQAFPSLGRFQAEVVSMLSGLLGGDARTAGAMTSGGTESILLAVKAYRDHARATGVARPKMIVPASAHPAFMKAAQYFDVESVVIPVGADYRADVARTANAIDERTVLLVASAPCFPYGTVDPITSLAEIAAAHGIGLHVDACVGAFILPFLRDLGHRVPSFDFSVPGVTSLSADLHKYGYALKGASAVLYRSADLRRHQFFVDTAWLGGLFGSPGILGTRNGGIIAAAWAALMRLGEPGYRDLAQRTWALAERIKAGILALPGLRLIGAPDMTVFAFTSETHDIFDIADRLAARGWHVDRQNAPRSIHLVVTPHHEAAAAPFLADLAAAVAAAAPPDAARAGETAALYGVTSHSTSGADPRAAVIAGLERSLDNA